MKQKNCEYCGQFFIPARPDQKYCKGASGRSKACKTRAYRKRKGIVEPSFLPTKNSALKIGRSRSREVAQVYQAAINQNAKAYRPTTEEEVLLLNQRNYWAKVYDDARVGVFPIFTLLGGWAGFKATKGKKGEDRLIGTLAGIFLGRQADKKIQEAGEAKKQYLMNYARGQIAKIDGQLRDIKGIDKLVKTLKASKVLSATKPTGQLKIVSSKRYRNAHIPTMSIKGKYNFLFGDPSPGFLMLVSGAPGNGKTTFAIELAQHFHENHGSVLYLPYEQTGMNKPLQNMLKKYDATFDVMQHPDKTIEEVQKAAKDYNFIFVDSVNHARFSAEDIEQLRKNSPTLSIILIMQNTKDGKFKGSQEFLHNCDVHIVLENGVAKQRKSRFAEGIAEIPIWDI